jgi:hypothetical protein
VRRYARALPLFSHTLNHHTSPLEPTCCPSQALSSPHSRRLHLEHRPSDVRAVPHISLRSGKHVLSWRCWSGGAIAPSF